MTSSKKSKSVLVLDSDQKALSYTSNAKARILLRKNKALVYHKDPFVLQLTETEGEGEEQMSKINSGVRGSSILSFTKFFAEERDIYVQNLGSTQISLSFPGIGDEKHYHTIPATRRPYNLTQYIPFESIKNSEVLRKMVNRRPAILALISEEECEQFYVDLSNRNGTTVDDEVGKTSALVLRLEQKPQISTDLIKKDAENLLQKKIEILEKPPEINARVIGLCAEADKDQGHSRISAEDFLDVLDVIRDTLKVEDWKFIMENCTYKTVRAFCSKILEKQVAAVEE